MISSPKRQYSIRSPRSKPHHVRSLLWCLTGVAAVIAFLNIGQAPSQSSLSAFERDTVDDITDTFQADVSELSDSFTLYYDSKGSCDGGLILRIDGVGNGVYIASLCQSNPNCTFFSASSSGEGYLCSGRASDLTTEQGWVSGDRTGCEDFSLVDSIGHSAAGLLPSCYAPYTHDCAYRNAATRRCLSDLVRSDQAPLPKMHENSLCVDAANKLRISPKSENSRFCTWSVERPSNPAVMTSTGLQKQLVPDLLHFDMLQGSLLDKRRCICDDPYMGLVIGLGCNNMGCQWTPKASKDGSSGCTYVNDRRGFCLEELLAYFVATSAKVLCLQPDDSMVIVDQQTKTSEGSTCITMENLRAKMPTLQSAISFDKELRTLSASGQIRCLCHNPEVGLVMGPYCGNPDCRWVPSAEVVEQQKLSIGTTGMQVLPNQRFSCGMQVAPAAQLPTLLDALRRCEETPSCSFVTYHAPSGMTMLCDGLYNDSHAYASVAQHWYSAYSKGCLVTEERLRQPGQILCRAPRQQPCACSPGQHMVLPCTQDSSAVCSQCPTGYCPALSQDLLVEGYDTMAATYFSSNGYNVQEMCTMKGNMYLYNRKAGILFLAQKWSTAQQPPHTSTLQFLKCSTSADTVVQGHQRACLSMSYNHSAPGWRITYDASSAQLVMYIDAMHMFVTTSWCKYLYLNQEKCHTVIMVLIFDSSFTRVIHSMPLEHHSQGLEIEEHTGWAPLVSKGQLYLVVKTNPLKLVEVDPTSGHTTVVYTGNQHKIDSKAYYPLTASSPYIPINSTHWLAIAHHREAYPYGSIYTHHTVLLGLEDPNDPFPTTASVSKPYRLPYDNDGELQDKQLADSVMVSDAKVYVMYTQNRCRSKMAVLPTTIFDLEIPKQQPEAVRPQIVRFIGQPSGSGIVSYVIQAFVERYRQQHMTDVQLQILPDSKSDRIASFAVEYVISSNTENNMPADIIITLDSTPTPLWRMVNKYWVHCILLHDKNYNGVSMDVAGADEFWIFHDSNNGHLALEAIDRTKVHVFPYPSAHACGQTGLSKLLSPARTVPYQTYFMRANTHAITSIAQAIDVFQKTFHPEDHARLVVCLPNDWPSKYRTVDKFLGLAGAASPLDIVQLTRCYKHHEDWTKELERIDVYIHLPRGADEAAFLMSAMSCSKTVILPQKSKQDSKIPSSNVVWYTGTDNHSLYEDPLALHDAFAQAYRQVVAPSHDAGAPQQHDGSKQVWHRLAELLVKLKGKAKKSGQHH